MTKRLKKMFRLTSKIYLARLVAVSPLVVLFVLFLPSGNARSLREAFCDDYSYKNRIDSSSYETQKSYNYCIRNSGRLIREYEDRKLREKREFREYQESLERQRRIEYIEYQRRRAAEQRSIDRAVEGINVDFR